MRRMPSYVHDPSTGDAIPLPVCAEWDERVLCLIARPVTSAEAEKIGKMRAHNWTVRIAAEAILGRDLTTAELQARK